MKNLAVLILDIRKYRVYTLENWKSKRFKVFGKNKFRSPSTVIETLILFEFSTVSPNGHDKYSSLHTFGESDYL